MKTTRTTWSGIGLACALALMPSITRGDMEVSASVNITAKADFDAPLAAQGAWIDVGGYGHCWHPTGVAADWRPYGEGRWVWTDNGWYWDSDEPWAWACYHYGYWVDDPQAGWVWIPDVDWGPAWVSWRCGGGYIGWAPVPPPRFYFFTRIAPVEQFSFVAGVNFVNPIRPAILRINDPVVLKVATETFKVTRESRTIGGASARVAVNNGPGLEFVEKAVGHSVQRVSIQEASARARVPAAAMQHRAATDRDRAVKPEEPRREGPQADNARDRQVESKPPVEEKRQPLVKDEPPVKNEPAKVEPGKGEPPAHPATEHPIAHHPPEKPPSHGP